MSRSRIQGKLVVDASVAHSAGGEDATHAQAIACRDALNAIYEADLRLVMSKALFEEWRRHSSRYSRKWLHRMFGHRRIAQTEPAEHQPTRNGALKHLPEAEQETLRKDYLIVDSALTAQANVISLDHTTRLLLIKLAEHVRQLRSLHWASPIDDGCLEWLKARTPKDTRFALRL